MDANNIDRILCIDYGEKRIGIAVSDPLRLFAIPVTTIKNDKNLWKNLIQLLDDYNVKKIVLGYPLSENGQKSNSTLMVEKFKGELEKRVKTEIVLFDERYSSLIAKDIIIKIVSSKKKRRNKELLDKASAAVILEDYLKFSDNK
ncbi:Holliday junction resolvase RuvX [Bacteroidota bacterium]